MGDADVARGLAAYVSLATQSGYMIGVLENNSGVARHTESEGHYWAAVVLASFQLSREAPDSHKISYCVYAGYHLGRKGDLAIPEILGRLHRDLEAA